MANETLEIAQRNAHTYDFYRDGFAVSDGALVDPGTVANLKEHCERVLSGICETGRAPRTNTGGPDIAAHPPYIEASWPQDADQTIAEFLRYPTLGPWVAKVTGAARVQIINCLTIKKYPTAHRKTRVGWHQDCRYHQFFRSGSSASFWIALDEVNHARGPVRFVRGSHLWNKSYSAGFFDHDNDEKDFELPEGKKWEEVETPLPAGWATLHGPGVIHGSGMCLGPGARLSILFTVGLSSPGHELAIDPNHYWAQRMKDESCPIIYELDDSAQARPSPSAAYLYDVRAPQTART